MMNNSKRWLTGLVQYHNCLLCKQLSNRLLCSNCQQDIPLYELAKYDYDLCNCQRVLTGLKASSFNKLVALAEYQWPLSTLITDLKFGGKSVNAKALADLFCANVSLQLGRPQAIIPIPLHSNRIATRQYNQAALMAAYIAKQWHIPYLPNGLLRTESTHAQTQLTGTERLNNTKQAFKINKDIAYDHIAVFDDVVTTGATVSSAAEIILNRYPNMMIDVWAICITPEYR